MSLRRHFSSQAVSSSHLVLQSTSRCSVAAATVAVLGSYSSPTAMGRRSSATTGRRGRGRGRGGGADGGGGAVPARYRHLQTPELTGGGIAAAASPSGSRNAARTTARKQGNARSTHQSVQWGNLKAMSDADRREVTAGGWRAANRQEVNFDEHPQQGEEALPQQDNKGDSHADVGGIGDRDAAGYAHALKASGAIQTEEDAMAHFAEEHAREEEERKLPTMGVAESFYRDLAREADEEIDVLHVRPMLHPSFQQEGADGGGGGGTTRARERNGAAVPPRDDADRREEERAINRDFFGAYYVEQGILPAPSTDTGTDAPSALPSSPAGRGEDAPLVAAATGGSEEPLADTTPLQPPLDPSPRRKELGAVDVFLALMAPTSSTAAGPSRSYAQVDPSYPLTRAIIRQQLETRAEAAVATAGGSSSTNGGGGLRVQRLPWCDGVYALRFPALHSDGVGQHSSRTKRGTTDEYSFRFVAASTSAASASAPSSNSTTTTSASGADGWGDGGGQPCSSPPPPAMMTSSAGAMSMFDELEPDNLELEGNSSNNATKNLSMTQADHCDHHGATSSPAAAPIDDDNACDPLLEMMMMPNTDAAGAESTSAAANEEEEVASAAAATAVNMGTPIDDAAYVGDPKREQDDWYEVLQQAPNPTPSAGKEDYNSGQQPVTSGIDQQQQGVDVDLDGNAVVSITPSSSSPPPPPPQPSPSDPLADEQFVERAIATGSVIEHSAATGGGVGGGGQGAPLSLLVPILLLSDDFAAATCSSTGTAASTSTVISVADACASSPAALPRRRRGRGGDFIDADADPDADEGKMRSVGRDSGEHYRDISTFAQLCHYNSREVNEASPAPPMDVAIVAFHHGIPQQHDDTSQTDAASSSAPGPCDVVPSDCCYVGPAGCQVSLLTNSGNSTTAIVAQGEEEAFAVVPSPDTAHVVVVPSLSISAAAQQLPTTQRHNKKKKNKKKHTKQSEGNSRRGGSMSEGWRASFDRVVCCPPSTADGIHSRSPTPEEHSLLPMPSSGSSDDLAVGGDVAGNFIQVLSEAVPVLHRRQLQHLLFALSLMRTKTPTTAATHGRGGGQGGCCVSRLVYATSSMNPLENEAVVAAAITIANANAMSSSGNTQAAKEYCRYRIGDVSSQVADELTSSSSSVGRSSVDDDDELPRHSFVGGLSTWKTIDLSTDQRQQQHTHEHQEPQQDGDHHANDDVEEEQERRMWESVRHNLQRMQQRDGCSSSLLLDELFPPQATMDPLFSADELRGDISSKALRLLPTTKATIKQSTTSAVMNGDDRADQPTDVIVSGPNVEDCGMFAVVIECWSDDLDAHRPDTHSVSNEKNERPSLACDVQQSCGATPPPFVTSSSSFATSALSQFLCELQQRELAPPSTLLLVDSKDAATEAGHTRYSPMSLHCQVAGIPVPVPVPISSSSSAITEQLGCCTPSFIAALWQSGHANRRTADYFRLGTQTAVPVVNVSASFLLVLMLLYRSSNNNDGNGSSGSEFGVGVMSVRELQAEAREFLRLPLLGAARDAGDDADERTSSSRLVYRTLFAELDALCTSVLAKKKNAGGEESATTRTMMLALGVDTSKHLPFIQPGAGSVEFDLHPVLLEELNEVCALGLGLQTSSYQQLHEEEDQQRDHGEDDVEHGGVVDDDVLLTLHVCRPASTPSTPSTSTTKTSSRRSSASAPPPRPRTRDDDVEHDIVSSTTSADTDYYHDGELVDVAVDDLFFSSSQSDSSSPVPPGAGGGATPPPALVGLRDALAYCARSVGLPHHPSHFQPAAILRSCGSTTDEDERGDSGDDEDRYDQQTIDEEVDANADADLTGHQQQQQQQEQEDFFASLLQAPPPPPSSRASSFASSASSDLATAAAVSGCEDDVATDASFFFFDAEEAAPPRPVPAASSASVGPSSSDDNVADDDIGAPIPHTTTTSTTLPAQPQTAESGNKNEEKQKTIADMFSELTGGGCGAKTSSMNSSSPAGSEGDVDDYVHFGDGVDEGTSSSSRDKKALSNKQKHKKRSRATTTSMAALMRKKLAHGAANVPADDLVVEDDVDDANAIAYSSSSADPLRGLGGRRQEGEEEEPIDGGGAEVLDALVGEFAATKARQKQQLQAVEQQTTGGRKKVSSPTTAAPRQSETTTNADAAAGRRRDAQGTRDSASPFDNGDNAAAEEAAVGGGTSGDWFADLRASGRRKERGMLVRAASEARRVEQHRQHREKQSRTGNKPRGGGGGGGRRW